MQSTVQLIKQALREIFRAGIIVSSCDQGGQNDGKLQDIARCKAAMWMCAYIQLHLNVCILNVCIRVHFKNADL